MAPRDPDFLKHLSMPKIINDHSQVVVLTQRVSEMEKLIRRIAEKVGLEPEDKV